MGFSLEELVSAVHTSFRDYDPDDTGHISSSDLFNITAALGERLDSNELFRALALLDQNKTGRIHKTEYTSWWLNRRPRDETGPIVFGDGGVISHVPRRGNKVAVDVQERAYSMMNEARIDRHMAEQELESMRNRLKHLSFEEKRMNRKIELTQRRTADVAAAKRRTHDYTMMMQEVENKKHIEQMQSNHNYASIKGESTRRKGIVHRAREQQLSRAREQRLVESRAHTLQRQRVEEQILAEAGAVRQRVYNSDRAAIAESARQRAALEAAARENGMSRVKAELERKAAAEVKLKLMAAEEQELLQKLKITKEAQEEALEQLGEALKL